MPLIHELDYRLQKEFYRADQAGWSFRALSRSSGQWLFGPTGSLTIGELPFDNLADTLVTVGRERIWFLNTLGQRVESDARQRQPKLWLHLPASRLSGGNLAVIKQLVLDQSEFPARGIWNIDLHQSGLFRIWVRLCSADPRPMTCLWDGVVVGFNSATTGSYEQEDLMWFPIAQVVALAEHHTAAAGGPAAPPAVGPGAAS